MNSQLLLNTNMRTADAVYHCNECLMHIVENRGDVCGTCKLIAANRAAQTANREMRQRVFIVGVVLMMLATIVAGFAMVRGI